MHLSIQEIASLVNENEKEAIDFLVEAVQTPSVTGEEQAVSKVYQKWIEKSGLAVTIYEKVSGRPNLISEWSGKEDGPTFVFNGHYDVFPPVPGNEGMYGPWAGKITDGKLYGRGSVDMKSGLCATVMAVCLLKRAGFIPRGKVILSCDCDEERTGEYGVNYLLEKGLLQGDFGICAEPTRPPGAQHSKVLVMGTAGWKVDITCKGIVGHASIPCPGTDAISAAISAIAAFRDYDRKIQNERYYEAFKKGPLCSVTMIQGGDAFNMHPGTCTFTMDRRLVPTETMKQAAQEIRAIMEEQKRSLGTEYDIVFTEAMPPYELNPHDPFIQELLDAYEQVTNEKTELYYRPGGSDAHKIVQAYNMCMPNFGPGTDLLSTTADEHVELTEYLKFIKIYMYLIVKLLG